MGRVFQGTRPDFPRNPMKLFNPNIVPPDQRRSDVAAKLRELVIEVEQNPVPPVACTVLILWEQQGMATRARRM